MIENSWIFQSISKVAVFSKESKPPSSPSLSFIYDPPWLKTITDSYNIVCDVTVENRSCLPIIEWMSDTHNFFLCTNALKTSKESPEKKVNFVYFFILLCWATLSCLSWRLYDDKCEAKSIFFLISNSSKFSYAYSTWSREKVITTAVFIIKTVVV